MIRQDWIAIEGVIGVGKTSLARLFSERLAARLLLEEVDENPFLELFYKNQGKENSEYVTDAFLTSVAKGAGVKDLARWEKERESKKLLKEVRETTAQAETFGFNGTPSFAIEGPSTNGVELLGSPGDTKTIEEEIEKAS